MKFVESLKVFINNLLCDCPCDTCKIKNHVECLYNCSKVTYYEDI